MADVFGLDLKNIEKNKLIRKEHVETVYGVLGGDPNYSDTNHVLQFNGSFLSGSSNEKTAGIDLGFAFGKNNRVESENGFVVGKDGLSYHPNQFVLSGGSILNRGDAQTYFYNDTLVSVPGNNPSSVSTIIPTRSNSLSSIYVELVGVKKNSDESISENYRIIFFNSREDPDSVDQAGKIYNLELDSLYESTSGLVTGQSPDIEVKFVVDKNNNHELLLKILDYRSSSMNDYEWSVHMRGTEVRSGTDIVLGGEEGFSTAQYRDKAVEYSDPITTCFVPDTEVVVSKDGKTEKISELSEGDEIFSFISEEVLSMSDHENYEGDVSVIDEFNDSKSVITEIFRGFVDNYYVINDEIRVTGSQPVFVYNKSNEKVEFVNVENLSYDHKLLNKSKEFVEVENINNVKEDREVVTLDVEKSDLFFAEGIMFHNKN